MKHTGMVIAWLNQRYTVTGTVAQCEAAIRAAQWYNLTAGWWSVASVLVWNWVAIVTNLNQRKRLHRNAAQAQATAAYWGGQYPGGPGHYPPTWAPPTGQG